MFDRNNDGYVVADEIKFVMSQLGHSLTDDEIKLTIAKADVDGDGRLDYNGELLIYSITHSSLVASVLFSLFLFSGEFLKVVNG